MRHFSAYPKLQVTYMNQACEMLFGQSLQRGERHSRNYYAAIYFMHIYKRLLEQKMRRSLFVSVLSELTNSNKIVTVDCVITPLNNDNWQQQVLLEIQQVDRQLRIVREENMVHQQRALRELVRGIAHEIKNPLGGLRGAAQLLESELTSADLKEYTQIIISEADRLKNLVNGSMLCHAPYRVRKTLIFMKC